MRYINLTFAQRSMLTRIRWESSKSQVRDRAFCILLSDQGQSISALTQAFEVHRNTILNWFNAFENDGLIGLYDEPGRGSTSILGSQHKDAIIAFVDAGDHRAWDWSVSYFWEQILVIMTQQKLPIFFGKAKFGSEVGWDEGAFSAPSQPQDIAIFIAIKGFNQI